MSNLSNLMISGSYLGLINLQDSTQNLASQTGDIELQDGTGANIGLTINAQTKEFTVVNNFKVDGDSDFNGDVDISGSLTHKGNVDITGSLTVRDDNAPMNGIILENNSGTGTVQIIPGGDFLTTFNSPTMTGIEFYGGSTLSGSWGEIGDISGFGGIGIKNVGIDAIKLSHNNYTSFQSAPNGNTTIKGNTIQLQPSSSATTSVEITGDITAGTGSFDTINARVLHVTIESSSVIFSSGSNVLGDEETDRQDLIGQVIVSGTLGVEGNSAFTGSLTVSNEISSSTLNGIGNVTIYSASVDSRLDALETDTGSQDQRLDSLEAFTGSQEIINSGYNAFTSSQENINGGYNTFTSSYYIDSASFDTRIDDLENFSSSLVQDFVSTPDFNSYTASQETINGFYNAFTASNGNTSLNTFTSSADGRLNNLEATTSSIDNRLNNIELTTSSLQVEIDGLSSFTGSYATTGSNIFDGNQVFSGSVQGNVNALTITSNTASIDCSTGNFFTVNLPSGSTTNLEASNIVPGLTITLQIEQPITGSGNIIFDTDNYSFPRLGQPSLTPQAEAVDIATFVSFDGSKLKGTLTNDLI